MRSYSEQLRDEIVDAAGRQHQARRRRRAVLSAAAGVVVVAGVAALIAGLLVGPSDDSATAVDAVRATRDEATTLIEIVEPDHPDDVIANLRAMGLDVERLERPTGPSNVGTVVSLSVDSDSRPANNSTGFLSVYVQAGVKVAVGVGVPAGENDLYDVATDAFAVGEPLHCSSWPGQSAAGLAAAVERLGLQLRVIDDESGPLEELPDDRRVVAATAVAADRVIVMVGDVAPAGPPTECIATATSG